MGNFEYLCDENSPELNDHPTSKDVSLVFSATHDQDFYEEDRTLFTKSFQRNN